MLSLLVVLALIVLGNQVSSFFAAKLRPPSPNGLNLCGGPKILYHYYRNLESYCSAFGRSLLILKFTV